MSNNQDSQMTADVLESFKQYEQFCKSMLDGWVVVDQTGRIVKCNQLFSILTGAKSKAILRAGTLDEVIAFSVAGKPLTVEEMLSSPGPTRYDEVIGNAPTKPDESLNCIIGLFPFVVNDKTVGAFLLVRDVTAEASLQDKYKDKATQSITDALTGLFNRNYFTQYLSAQIKTHESFPDTAPQKAMSVIMMDIDFFKKINDVYGHAAGDHVLKLTSDIMKKCFRRTDVVARYGGEEFLAILPGTDQHGAAIAADKFRAAIEANVFEFEGTRIPVTISIGVAQIYLGSETGDQAVARADAALYSSKHNGRNQVSIHDGRTVRPYKGAHSAA